MRQYVLAVVFCIASVTLAQAQTCVPSDPATALGTYKTDFDGGRMIPPPSRRTPPPSALDVPDPRLTLGVTNPRVTQENIAQNILQQGP